jgi:hypothetical protein
MAVHQPSRTAGDSVALPARWAWRRTPCSCIVEPANTYE